MVTIVEIIVKIIATKPTFLFLGSFCKKYLTPGQSPKGGKKILTK